MNIGKITFIIILLLSFFLPVQAQESERILNFNSNITIHKDSSILVEEYIRVQSAAIEIRRGIYRDIPTVYRDRFYFAVKKPISVISVTRDGVKEPYRIEQQGITTNYIGTSQVTIGVFP